MSIAQSLAQAGASWLPVSADLFDKTALLFPPKQHYRVTTHGGRLYYTIDEPAELVGGVSPSPKVTVFLSVNTICDAVLPTSKFLIDWWKKHGANADTMANAAAHFGTFEHSLLSKYYVEGRLPMLRRRRGQGMKAAEKDLLAIAEEYIAQNHPKMYDPSDWAMKASRDLPVLFAFEQEHGFIPIFVEGILSARIETPSGPLNIAGAVDVVGWMGRGNKQKLIILDYKSGQHDNKGNKKYQLALRMYKLLFELNYPHLGPVQSLYNLAPKKWTKTPTYHLDDQTDAISERELQLLMELAAINAAEPRARLKQVVGELVRGDSTSLEIEEFELEDQILYGHKLISEEVGS